MIFGRGGAPQGDIRWGGRGNEDIAEVVERDRIPLGAVETKRENLMTLDEEGCSRCTGWSAGPTWGCCAIGCRCGRRPASTAGSFLGRRISSDPRSVMPCLPM